MAKAEYGYTYHSKFGIKYILMNILEMEKMGFFQKWMDRNG